MRLLFSSTKQGICISFIPTSEVDTYVDNFGGGFLDLPIVEVKGLPNRLRRSEALRSPLCLFLGGRLVGAESSSNTLVLGSLGDAEIGVEGSLECRLALSFRELAFSFSEDDSADRPNNRLRFCLASKAWVVSLCRECKQ